MKKILRVVLVAVLLMLLAAALLFGVVVASKHLFDDEKIQYFTIGYYLAIHVDLVRWIWKKLGLDTKRVSDEL